MIFPQGMLRGAARRFAGRFALACLCAAGVAQADSAVWSIKGSRNTVYLAGSVHALPRDGAALPAELERAYQDADIIVMEVDLDDLDPLEGVQFVAENGTLPADRTLADVVGAQRYAGIAKLAEELGLPEVALARLEPWAAAMVLTQFALMKSGYDPQLGIDMQITARARADNKRVDGLETIIDQLGIFDTRSLEDQIKFLAATTDEAANMEQDLARLVTAWRAGDLKGLEREFDEERAHAPALYDALLGDRNRKWLPQIQALLDDEQDYLVLVGALHFVGRDSLLTLLTRAGHRPVPLPAGATRSAR